MNEDPPLFPKSILKVFYLFYFYTTSIAYDQLRFLFHYESNRNEHNKSRKVILFIDTLKFGNTAMQEYTAMKTW